MLSGGLLAGVVFSALWLTVLRIGPRKDGFWSACASNKWPASPRGSEEFWWQWSEVRE